MVFYYIKFEIWYNADAGVYIISPRLVKKSFNICFQTAGPVDRTPDWFSKL